MPLPPSLGKSFYKWARPKLRPLVEAHSSDKKAGIKRYGSFNKLILQYSEEFKQMPFAQPDFEEYLDEDGEPTMSVTLIRERAEQWLRNHARTSRSTQLSKFEAQGGVSENSPSRAKSAAELWAADKKAKIRKATCEYLGIPVTTGNNALPAEFIGARKTVVKREFALLPQADQDEWTALAREEKESAALDQASVISIQERQMSFAPWIDSMMGKRVKGGPLGDTFVMQFTGYFVRARDRQLERFRGQVDSGTSPSWFKSEAFKEVVGPAWTDFIHQDVEDKLAPPLPKFPVGATGDALKQARADLTVWIETMFRLACNFSSLDVKAFWKDVAEDPDVFVSPDRLPEDVEFANPKHMPEEDFCELYKHIWRSQNRPNTVERDALFIFEADAVRDHVTLERVQHLKREQQRRTRKAAASTSSGGTSAQATDDDGAPGTTVTEGPVPPATAAITSSEASAPRRDEEEVGAVSAAAAALIAAEANVPTPVDSEAMQVDAADASKSPAAVPPTQSSEDAANHALALQPYGAASGRSSPAPSRGARDSTPDSEPAAPPKARGGKGAGRDKATAGSKTASKTATKATNKEASAGANKPLAKPDTRKRRVADEDRASDASPTSKTSGPTPKKPRYATRRKAADTK